MGTAVRRALLTGYGLLALVVWVYLVSPWKVPPWMLPLSTALLWAFAWLHAGARYGWPRALLFWGLTTLLTLGLETLGVLTGWVYGPYHYTAKLGPRCLGVVPCLIPAAWFMALYPATVVAERTLPPGWSRSRRWWALPALAGLTMTAWDLVMDPLMVGGGYWVWERPGAYFGIPLHNFVGWWATTALVVWAFLGMSRGGVPRTRAADREAVVAYALIGLGNVAHALALGYLGPALVGFFALAPWVWAAWWAAPDFSPAGDLP